MKKEFFPILVALLCSLCSSAQTVFPFDVKITGEGKKNMILIPGLSCSGDVWNETTDRYKKEYKCYVLTFHGFAGHPADAETSYKNWEAMIANYIKENKIEQPVIVGHSIGGGLALLLAADYPGLIGKIVVVDALPCLGALQNPAFSANPDPDCGVAVKQFQSMDDKQFYAMQKQNMPSLMADTVHLAQAIGWSVTSDRKAMAEIYCQFFNTDLRNTIATVQCPSLVLLEGAFSGMKEPVAEQYKKLKNADLEYATKGLHFVMYDDTDWYFQQLDKFLK